jgi:serine/threonine-protein kinase HipA
VSKKINITHCPITLEPGFDSYSIKGLRHLYNGKKISHTLNYVTNRAKEEAQKLLIENKTRISISGVQEKFSFKVEKKILKLTDTGGTYIVKPIPRDLLYVNDVPANEHVTMQIALQIFKLNVAKNGLGFFFDGEPVYITKRFDVVEDGTKYLMEDFASLLGKTNETGSKNYKYESSYEEMAKAIDKSFPAAMVAKEQLFKLAVFNYLVSNGDAHLKNFSVIDYNRNGNYELAPAYDLICTRPHTNDGDFALEDRLYADDYKHPSYEHYGYHAYDDFYDFGIRIGLLPKRITSFLALFLSKKNEVEAMIGRSFLSATIKKEYLKWYNDKLRRLQISLTHKI